MTRFLASYWGRDPQAAAADFAGLRRRGFAGVNLPCSEERMLYDLSGTQRVADAAVRAGLWASVSPWGVGGYFGGEGVRRAGDAFRNAAEWLSRALTLGVDAIYWDEPHGEEARAALRVLTGLIPERMAQVVYWNPAVGPHPDATTLRRMGGVATDCYDRPPAKALELAQDLAGMADGARPEARVWVRAFGLAAGAEADAAAQVRALAGAGADWVDVWGYPAPGCSTLDNANGAAAFATIADAVADVTEGAA